MRTPLRLLLPAAVLVAAALPARADSVLLKDGRTLDCPKVEKADGGWKLVFQNGEVLLPADLVKEAFHTTAAGEYEPKDDAEKEKVAKGLVPHEGKWVPKAQRDAAVAKKAADARKRIEDAKAHREWRNRYKEKTANFEFEYTIPPDIAKGYMDMMETYYAYFTRQFSCARPPKEKLKVCFYHDYDTFLEVSGASYGVLAYYRFVAPRELNFYYDRLRPDETTAIMFHEAQHYLSHLFDLKFHIPHNFSESMAEYFGGSKWDPAAKKMTTGGLQEGRLTEVQTDIAKGERKSLEKLLKNELGYDDYTWGWTFVHFLMETPKYSKKFQAFYRSLSSSKEIRRVPFQGDMVTIEGPELLRAFKKALGVDDVAALEKEWNAYIDTKLKLESVAGYEEAAFSASGSGRPLRAKRFFKLAVEKGSTNPTVYLKYGGMLEGTDNAGAAEMYRKGLKLDPVNPSLWAALGRLTKNLDGEENKAAGKKMIALARELDPDSVDTWLLVEDAMEKEGPAARPPGGSGGGEGGGDD